jgi:murein DD-endopeptidase MepM/ murein hydrolase activator NlpD
MAFDSTRRGLVGGCLCALAGFAAHPASAAARPVIGRLSAPVQPACISSPFGRRKAAGPHAAAFHNGIDFPAPEGALVHAAGSGKVLRVGRLDEFGLAVDLLHRDARGREFVTRYAHLGTIAPALAEGAQTVTLGQPVGHVGRSGITYGTHVHFEVHVGGEPIDPAPFFNVPRCG